MHNSSTTQFVEAQFVEVTIRRLHSSSTSQFIDFTIRRRHYSSMSLFVDVTIRRHHSSSNRENLHKNQISGSSLKDALLKTFNRSLRSTWVKKAEITLKYNSTLHFAWSVPIVFCNLHEVYWKFTVLTHIWNFILILTWLFSCLKRASENLDSRVDTTLEYVSTLAHHINYSHKISHFIIMNVSFNDAFVLKIIEKENSTNFRLILQSTNSVVVDEEWFRRIVPSTNSDIDE